MSNSKLVALLSCPACKAPVKASPNVAPGRSWLAVLPCPACGDYSAYMITETEGARSWVLRRGDYDLPAPLR